MKGNLFATAGLIPSGSDHLIQHILSLGLELKPDLKGRKSFVRVSMLLRLATSRRAVADPSGVDCAID